MNPGTSSKFDLTGRTALITGSSAGIGLALAQGWPAPARAWCSTRATRASSTGRRAAARRRRARVHAVPFDVTDAAAVAEAVARIEAEIGPIDILVNNAGMQHRAPLRGLRESRTGTS